MKLHAFLKPHMTTLYRDQPAITTAEAVRHLCTVLNDTPEGQAYLDRLIEMGMASVWGGFYGRLRQAAQRRIKKAITKRQPISAVTDLALQMKLPLADPDCSPTLAECTVLMIRESIRYLRQHRSGLDSQIAFYETIATQLTIAGMRTGNPDLMAGEAAEMGLIDWQTLAAA